MGNTTDNRDVIAEEFCDYCSPKGVGLLHVDDDPNDLAFIKRAMDGVVPSKLVRFEQFDCPEGLLRHLLLQRDQFHGLISDIIMPRVDGIKGTAGLYKAMANGVVDEGEFPTPRELEDYLEGADEGSRVASVDFKTLFYSNGVRDSGMLNRLAVQMDRNPNILGVVSKTVNRSVPVRLLLQVLTCRGEVSRAAMAQIEKHTRNFFEAEHSIASLPSRFREGFRGKVELVDCSGGLEGVAEM